MKGERILLAGTAVVAAAAVLTLGGALAPGGDGPAVAAGAPLAVAPTARTEREVRTLELRVRRSPRDAGALAALGLAYQQRARETSDPAYLGQSERALRRALRAEPGRRDAVAGLASLALVRHDFRAALALGRRALATAPDDARATGAVADALLELGRYREAFALFDALAVRRPSVASYARVAYARELLGRPGDAIAAMELAVRAGAGRPEAEAWSRVELGKLHFGLGRLRRAEVEYGRALAVFPGYPQALDALARLEAARGRYGSAIRLAERASAGVPLPSAVSTLAEVLRASGRRAEARRQDALVRAMGRLLAANGVRSDLELALYDVDQGLRLRDALARARRAHRDRPGIVADDVLGWALTRNGRCAEGLRYAHRALRLGTRDAVLLFHRGMAERCAGQTAAARRSFRVALALNPHFSVRWAPVARRYAR